MLHLLKICQINYPDRLSISLRSFNSLFWYKIKFEFRVFVEFFILFSVLVNSLAQDGLITLLPDQVVWLEVQLHSFISMSLSLSWSFSILTKFELWYGEVRWWSYKIMRWCLFLCILIVVLHCPCCLTMCKIESCCCCLGLFQFLSIHFSGKWLKFSGLTDCWFLEFRFSVYL